MKLSLLHTIAAIIYAVFGIGFLLLPTQLGSLYKLTFDAQATLLARIFGAAVFAFAVLVWFARNDGDSRAGRAVVYANLVYDVLGAVLSLIGVTTPDMMNSLGWSAVILYLLLAIGYGYFTFMRPAQAAGGG